MTTVTRPATGENDARPGYRPKPIVSAASAGSLVQFANRKNLPCVSMASLGAAKLANPLMTKAYYCSLGSATTEINYLGETGESVSDQTPM